MGYHRAAGAHRRAGIAIAPAQGGTEHGAGAGILAVEGCALGIAATVMAEGGAVAVLAVLAGGAADTRLLAVMASGVPAQLCRHLRPIARAAEFQGHAHGQQKTVFHIAQAHPAAVSVQAETHPVELLAVAELVLHVAALLVPVVLGIAADRHLTPGPEALVGGD